MKNENNMTKIDYCQDKYTATYLLRITVNTHCIGIPRLETVNTISFTSFHTFFPTGVVAPISLNPPRFLRCLRNLGRLRILGLLIILNQLVGFIIITL